MSDDPQSPEQSNINAEAEAKAAAAAAAQAPVPAPAKGRRNAPAAAPAAAAAPTFTVAPGRTITADGKHYGPGDKVPLTDPEEIERFTALGFILGADGSRAVAASGPAVLVDQTV